jgi:hypothetical protein
MQASSPKGGDVPENCFELVAALLRRRIHYFPLAPPGGGGNSLRGYELQDL